MQQSISYDRDTADNWNSLYTTTLSHYSLRLATGASVNDGIPKTIAFILDGSGQVIRQDETRTSRPTEPAPHEAWFRSADSRRVH